MKTARFLEIKALVERFDKLPDEGFVAALEEHNVSRKDLGSYAKEREKLGRSVRLARRR